MTPPAEIQTIHKANRRDEPARVINQPEEGFFLLRRDKAWVPAAIFVDDEGLWFAWINGEQRGEPMADPELSPEVMEVWQGGRAITAQQFKAETETARASRPFGI